MNRDGKMMSGKINRIRRVRIDYGFYQLPVVGRDINSNTMKKQGKGEESWVNNNYCLSYSVL